MEPRNNDRYIDYIHSYNYSTLQDLPHTRTHMSLRLCSCLPSTVGFPLTVWTIEVLSEPWMCRLRLYTQSTALAAFTKPWDPHNQTRCVFPWPAWQMKKCRRRILTRNDMMYSLLTVMICKDKPAPPHHQDY